MSLVEKLPVSKSTKTSYQRLLSLRMMGMDIKRSQVGFSPNILRDLSTEDKDLVSLPNNTKNIKSKFNLQRFKDLKKDLGVDFKTLDVSNDKLDVEEDKSNKKDVDINSKIEQNNHHQNVDANSEKADKEEENRDKDTN